jgi:hypothetical protein
MLIHGGCHCGNIRFALTWLPAPAAIPARACGCSFCVKHGGVWSSCAGGALRVTVRDAGLVQRYVFGTRTADFHVCRVCGVVPLVSSDIAGRRYAVVNVNAFEDFDRSLLQQVPVSFDEERAAQRRVSQRQRSDHFLAHAREALRRRDQALQPAPPWSLQRPERPRLRRAAPPIEPFPSLLRDAQREWESRSSFYGSESARTLTECRLQTL